mmetsp:Transcript_37875/g.121508  ORF Transcript_37875/g.121508 Transcript_37875/m.121508 type:complete len:343 (-) Transcript_37875:1312-2340(-)
MHQEPLRPDARQSDDPTVQRPRCDTRRHRHWTAHFFIPRGRRRPKRLRRQLPEDDVQRQIHHHSFIWGGQGTFAAAAVVDDFDEAVVGDGADDVEEAVFAVGDLADEVDVVVVFFEQESVGLLVLCAPDFDGGHRRVPEGELGEVVDGTFAVDDLLQDVAVAAAALVVDRRDGLDVAPTGEALAAGPNDAVHAIAHLGVAALDGVKVEGRRARRRHAARRRAAAHADLVGRPADLRDLVPRFRGGLPGGPRPVEPPDARGEHHRLDPLAPRPQSVPPSKAPAVARDHRLPELVPVVRRPVRRAQQNLQGRRHVRRVRQSLVLLAQVVQVVFPPRSSSGRRPP